ncbi:hypothetical protein [Phaeacidiphilus oryzae]|uniref:hypothetical protein n=1 Tax=Phaeacidiphilus oryzae TaxID=348818 RepID=UPI0005631B4B|nr:hypothetical protein [Phaeacidiphilus oryzae]
MGDAGYDRPPYRVEAVERTSRFGKDLTPRQRAAFRWLVELVFPWLLARRFYGPYRMLRLTPSALVAASGPLIGPYAGPVAGSVAEEAFDPLIERLMLPRALLGLGVVLLIVRLSTGTSMNDLFTEVFGDSIVVLFTGPLALLLASAAVVGLARHGARLRVSRMVLRPLLVALLTAGIAALVMAMERQNGHVPDLGVHNRVLGALGFLVMLGLMFWIFAFTLPAMYLMHRNSFAVRAHPLVRPLTSVLLVWLTALGHAELIDGPVETPHTAAWWIGLVAGPIGVTLTAVVELVLLRLRLRVGFRGPLPPRAKGAPRAKGFPRAKAGAKAPAAGVPGQTVYPPPPPYPPGPPYPPYPPGQPYPPEQPYRSPSQQPPWPPPQ